MATLKQKLVHGFIRGVLPLALLLLLLFITNPYHLPLLVLILPFVLIFILAYQSVYLLFGGTLLSGSRRKRRLNAGIIAGGISTLALLQSIRQLGSRDFIIIMVLVVGLSFYIRRIDL